MYRSSTTRIVPRSRAGLRGAAAPAWPIRLVVAGLVALSVAMAGCLGTVSRPSTMRPSTIAPSASTTASTTASSPASATPELMTGRVVSVADGDTIRVRLGGTVERVRVIGLDTPEVDAELRTPACFGAEASGFAEATLDGRTVGLELDPTQDERDRFGRLLAHVWVDGRLYAEAAIRGGFGIHYVYDRPSVHAAAFEAAEEAARRAGAGLWSACEGRVDLPLASP